ncbi:DNA adenine methylase [Nocardioides sp.]|uniref:DNA adenine methylase n=1 Tax=Nocardioides sp. TaxID=35761 RepID=UPI00261BAFD0|nr:DNA adenine methylase [Nocardioides sp.]MDI6911507.1 DNA adenine methylase [Nocardioides sp.]
MPTGDNAPTKPALGYYSPLRYPGGKARLARYIADLIRAQDPRPLAYAEPFAGGAGAALKLLAEGVVDEIHVNDLDPGIAAFWRCVYHRTDELVRSIEHADVSIDTWHEQRTIYSAPADRDDLELGFATFFLNRCNRSGILTARPIGGLEQTGQWLIDARFNRTDLVDRIRYIAEFRHRVHLTELDARDFISSLAEAPDVMLYVDPPYIVQGDALYLDKLSYDDHRGVAEVLRGTDLRWFMTYDCDARITDELYPDLRCARFNIKHTAQHQHVGSEYAIFSDRLVVPHIGILPKDEADWVVV